MRLNNLCVALAYGVHMIMSAIGMFLVAICFYIKFANWGNLETSFFLGPSIIIGLFGVAFVAISSIGNTGIHHQMRSYGDMHDIL